MLCCTELHTVRAVLTIMVEIYCDVSSDDEEVSTNKGEACDAM